jgi:glycerol dehydrogenase
MAVTKFVAPVAYVQGPNVLSDAGDRFDVLSGSRAYLVGGETALSLTEEILVRELNRAGIETVDVQHGVERCTYSNIEHVTDRVRSSGADVVVGIGGGVAIDVATVAADEVGTELVTVPTIASTDAPTSTVGVVYDEEQNFVDVLTRDRNPELVLVDSRVIADAPARFLAYGMGDALATPIEAEAAMRAGAETFAGAQTNPAALVLAQECLDRIKRHGPGALAAVERNALAPAVEKIIETNVLLSGIGFESAGLAGAHAVQVGLTNVGVREPHGVLVAFGTVTQLILEGREDVEVGEICALLDRIGLAVTLEDFGVTDDRLLRAGEEACANGMEDMPFDVTPIEVADAMRTADTLVSRAADE